MQSLADSSIRLAAGCIGKAQRAGPGAAQRTEECAEECAHAQTTAQEPAQPCILTLGLTARLPWRSKAI